MNTNVISEEIASQAFEECIQFFRNNRSYIQLDEVQESRCNINLLKINPSDLKETVQLKDMIYNDIHGTVFMTIPIKYIVPGERVHSRNARKIRYNLMPMIDTIDLLENMADVFINGNKLSINDITIALFDDYFVIGIPFEYKNATTIDVLMRPTLMEKYSSTNTITVQKSELINKDKQGFLAYVDGRLTEKVSILEYDTYYVYKCNEAVNKSFDLCFIRNLVKYGKAQLTNGFVWFNKYINKFPISANNIIPFKLDQGGILCNLDLLEKTSNVFKSQTTPKYTDYDFYYVYEERLDDDTLYHDNYKWYVDNVLKTDISDLALPEKLPEFMNAFALFKKEISLANFVKEKDINGDRNLFDYNTRKLSDAVEYDQELFLKFRQILERNFDNNILKQNDFIDVTTEYIVEHTRTGTNKDLLNVEHHIEFQSPMILIKVPNYDNNHFNIYVDGLRNHFYTVEFEELGITYVYILKNRVSVGSVIQIEKFKFSKNLKKTEFVGNGTKSINISNAKLNGLVGEGGTYNFKLLQSGDNLEIGISDILYDKILDILTVKTSINLSSSVIYNLYNMNYISVYKYETRRKGENLELDISSMKSLVLDKRYFRVFKNGREVHKDKFSISNNKLTINAKYTLYELIEVEYSPIVYEEMYLLNNLPLDNTGELNLYQYQIDNPDTTQYFLNGLSQYITVNGRRIDPKKYKYWCSQGATIHNVKSKKWCRIVNETYQPVNSLLTNLTYGFKNGNHLYDKYIVGTMIGGPIEDTESDYLDENIERVGELYYDLYKEFLKHNIIDIGAKMPEYIAIKYSGLIDTSRNDSIMIDARDKQLYWMPLDATMQHEEHMLNVLNLYYKLMDDMQVIQVIDPNDIPDEIYQKYKELFDNNVLVLQIPDIPPM